ncbi:MAG: flagellar basal body-associated FliL family protein [Anaerolineae bacterium]|jgi:flagellar FliL protein
MRKVLSPKVIVPLVAVLAVVGMVGYILFAPPTMWKPVYIRFEETASAEQAPSPAASTAQPTPPPVGVMIPYRPGSGIMYDLGTKIVNLAEPGGRRYLQVGVVLECLPHDPGFYQLQGEARAKAEAEVLEELDSRKPVLDDTVISILTSRTFAEIFTLEGKERLKEEMRTQVNTLLGYDQVASVYFTEFLVQ